MQGSSQVHAFPQEALDTEISASKLTLRQQQISSN